MTVLSPLGPVCRECCQWWGRLLSPGVGRNLLGGTGHPVTRGNSEISLHDLPLFPRDVPKEHWMLQARCALGGGSGWKWWVREQMAQWSSLWVLSTCGCGAMPCRLRKGCRWLYETAVTLCHQDNLILTVSHSVRFFLSFIKCVLFYIL